jgi:hypothetical protein
MKTEDYDYRNYETKVDVDGQTVYFKPESPQCLFTKDALPKPPKATPTPVKAQVKPAAKVAPSKNSAVNFYTKQVAAKTKEYNEAVASDKKSNPNLPLSQQTTDIKIQLQTAKENLAKEVKTPLKNVPL